MNADQPVRLDSANGLKPPGRYSTIPFPPYRFIPGRHPHPTAHPQGHSYRAPGDPPVEVRLVAPEDWASSENYLFACDLYNHGYWWEAHEEWEGLWQLTDKRSAQGHLLQGLIQVSACHLKHFVGHREGVQRLLRTSMEHLRITISLINDSACMGLTIRPFVHDVEIYYRDFTVTSEQPGKHDPLRYPYVRLST